MSYPFLPAPPSPQMAVLAKAKDVFGSIAKADHWMHHPVSALGDKCPIDVMLEPDGQQQVLDTLGRIEHGVFS